MVPDDRITNFKFWRKAMTDFKQAFAFVLQHEDSTRSGNVTVDAGGRTRLEKT